MGPTCEIFSLPSERAKRRNQVKLILTTYFTPLKDGRDGIVSTWNQHITANEILGVLFLVWVIRAQHVLRVPIGRPHVTNSAATHAGGSSTRRSRRRWSLENYQNSWGFPLTRYRLKNLSRSSSNCLSGTFPNEEVHKRAFLKTPWTVTPRAQATRQSRGIESHRVTHRARIKGKSDPCPRK